MGHQNNFSAQHSRTLPNLTLPMVRGPAGTPPPPYAPISGNRFNILLLGETQAGKTTFVQAVKSYGNPNHEIESDAIGDGNTSQTMEVVEHIIRTRYPLHEVHKVSKSLAADGPTLVDVDVDSILEEYKDDWEDFQDCIGKRTGLSLHRAEDQTTQMHEIHIYDTPGLNDTSGDDERHVASILKAIRDMDHVHLVLVMVGPSAFTAGARGALQSYMDVFPEFQGIISFIHTKYKYVNLHPQREAANRGLAERKKILHGIMGRESCNHHTLDIDFQSKRPILKCITWNIIRRILLEAPTNLPISFRSGMIHKTPKMKEIDKIILHKYNRLLTAASDTLHTKDTEQATNMEQITELDALVNKLKIDIGMAKAFIDDHNTDEYEFLDECNFQQKWKMLKVNTTFTWEAFKTKHIIRKYVKQNEHFYFVKTEGGVGSTFCKFELLRHAYQKGRLHVKFYTTSKEKFKDEIAQAYVTCATSLEEFMDAHDRREVHKEQNSQIILETKPLLEKNERYSLMVAKAQETTIELERFLEDTENKMYSGEIAHVAELVEARYSLAISSPDFCSKFKVKE